MSGLDDDRADLPIRSMMSIEKKENADLNPISSDFHMGDRYWRKGSDLIEAVARDTIVFHKTLADS